MYIATHVHCIKHFTDIFFFNIINVYTLKLIYQNSKNTKRERRIVLKKKI